MNMSKAYTKITNKIWYLLKIDNKLKNVDDEKYLKILYFFRMRKRLNLDLPQDFNEKLQWLKLNDRNQRYTRLVDKVLVKEEVRRLLGEKYLVPTLGVWSDATEIDFSKLPNQFVLKVNHDSGGVIICRDKEIFDTSEAIGRLNESLRRSYYWSGREYPYRDVPPLVFAEKYLPNYEENISLNESKNKECSDQHSLSDASSIVDYKFFCFNGNPRFLNIQQNMFDSKNARFAFLNLDWTRTDFGRIEYPEYENIPLRPESLDEMIEIAKELSRGIPFVRVDLFEHGGEVLFSEMTFYPTTGMIPFKPLNAGKRIGAWLDLPEPTR